MKRSFRHALILSLACTAALVAGPLMGAPIDDLQKSFATPPDNARIMVRWWWFGPAVTKDGIDHELKVMKDGGIGGVEVQPTYPLSPDTATIKNIKWMSPEFLDMLNHTAAQCKATGMRMDLTFGSGWPYGGPRSMFDPATDGAKALTIQSVQAAAGQATVQVPNNGDIFAAFAGPGTPAGALLDGPDDGLTFVAAGAGGGRAAGGGRGRGGGGGGGGGDMSAFKEVPVKNGVATLPAGFAGGQVLLFGYRPNIMAVKRPAYGADGIVIDHLSARVVDKFIEKVAEPELKACGANPPFAVFCDSLEINGENWTDDFLAEFQKRRGYDLRPLLPALFGNMGDRTEDIRHDYGQTVTELFSDNFNARFKALANKYGSKYRVQGYGSPPAALVSYASADLPEGEGGGNANWRTFRATRFASSASHLMGQPMTSSETFTWLHGAPFRATPLDMKGEVDTHFLDGVNQIICHGWGYTPPGVPAPGWSFYAAACFSDKNPWYVAMPEVTGYMQRVSAILREGTPANDVAVYMADSDLWARAGTGFSSMNGAYTSLTGVLDQVIDWGYNLDGFDDGMLAAKGKVEGGELVFGDVKYKVVVLNGPQHMMLATAQKLEAFAKGGGTLICIGNIPTKAPGYKMTAADEQSFNTIIANLFTAQGAPGIRVGAENQLGETLTKKLAPDMAIEPLNPAVGTVHRHTDAGELYFVANTSNVRVPVKATFRVDGMQAEEWNAQNGKVHGLTSAKGAVPGTTTVALDLPAYGSTIVMFTKRATPLPAPVAAPANIAAIDLSTNWNVKFGEKTVPMPKLQDWTQLAGMTNYSGVGTYEKTVTLTAEQALAGLWLSLASAAAGAGGGGGGAGGRGGGQGFAANFDSPVRDAAVVYINGKRAGAAWCPPFKVDVSDFVKPGENTIRIDVGNTEVNMINGHFPNYDQRGADAQFPPGNRFQAQGVNLLTTPLPSGLAGPITLEPHGK